MNGSLSVIGITDGISIGLVFHNGSFACNEEYGARSHVFPDGLTENGVHVKERFIYHAARFGRPRLENRTGRA